MTIDRTAPFQKSGGSLPTCSDPTRPLIPADPHGLRETEGIVGIGLVYL
jgi:hypothetical protein